MAEHQMRIGEMDAAKEELLAALLAVNRLEVNEILSRPYAGIPSILVVEKIVVPVLEDIGIGWEKGVYSLSQIYMAGRMCEDSVELILPSTDITRQSQPVVAIVTLDDYHMLGKRIVYSTLRASGIELLNLGRMEVEKLATKVVEEQIKILLISVLMLSSALKVKDLRACLKQSNVSVKIVVGGAPFRLDKQLWREVGADACGITAVDAIDIVHKIMEELE